MSSGERKEETEKNEGFGVDERWRIFKIVFFGA